MDVRITKKRDYRPHSEVLSGARVLLHMAGAETKGRYYLWMGSLLLAAFTLEGYLNFLGRLFYPSWESFERNLSWSKKIKLLGDRFGVVFDEGAEPLQTMKALFQFRDRIAHPKPREMSANYVKPREEMTSPIEMYEHLKSDEEKFCTEENAKLCLERVDEMMELLYKNGQGTFEKEFPYLKDSYVLYAPFVRSSQSGSYSI